MAPVVSDFEAIRTVGAAQLDAKRNDFASHGERALWEINAAAGDVGGERRGFQARD
jgi:hypothetical protein